MGAWVSGGISGGHLNPAVSHVPCGGRTILVLTWPVIGYPRSGYLARISLAQSSWYVGVLIQSRRIDSPKFRSGYIFAQVLGGVIGAGLVYGNYLHAIEIFEGGSGIRTRATADLFATYAVRDSNDRNKSRNKPWGLLF